eukprot:m.366706 g.366706  ORF g.366706 m.366706 type:complete len:150 (-) comp20823_c0_seq31:185-634(-)
MVAIEKRDHRRRVRTVKSLTDTCIHTQVRLAHKYGISEAKKHIVNVSLGKLFHQDLFKVVAVEERTLTGIAPSSSVHRLHWTTQKPSLSGSKSLGKKENISAEVIRNASRLVDVPNTRGTNEIGSAPDFQVSMSALQIRTFYLFAAPKG